MDLYLLKFNNYYNRIVKLFPTLEEYMSYVLPAGTLIPNESNPIANVNFIPGDDVDTTQVINWSGTAPDYVLLVDDGQIKSRWYVVDHRRTSAGQYVITLHRDVISDYYYDIINAPVFIEKATVHYPNPLIFNSEDMTFNQIKKKEIPLPDYTGCPWIVIYAAQKNGDGNTATYTDNIQVDIPVDVVFSAQTWQPVWFNRGASGYCSLRTLDFIGNYLIGSSMDIDTKTVQYTLSADAGGAMAKVVKQNIPNQTGPLINNPIEESRWNAFFQKWTDIENSLGAYISGYNQTMLDYWLWLNNKTIKIVNTETDIQYYRVQARTYVKRGTLGYKTGAGNYKNLIDQCLTAGDIYKTVLNSDAWQYAGYQYQQLEVTLESLAGITNLGSFDIGSNRFHNSDAPYDLFCMPYDDYITIKNSKVSDFKSVVANRELAFQFARTMTTKYSGAGTVYDAQLLPYCPITYATAGGDEIDLNTEEEGYTPIIQNGSTVGYVLHATVSSFSIDSVGLNSPIQIEDYKIESQCDLYRLCSPNYNGVFEFNAAFNGGISKIHAVCTYKPYNPYIKVYPEWGELYGITPEYGDARGLICGGDFSLPVVTDAWKTYELQNKNYQNTFDRQIQNMEVKNNIARIQEKWQFGTGIMTGVLNGAQLGSELGMAGGGVGMGIGMAAGAVAGGALSAAGGLMDLKHNEQLRAEALSYAKDQFGYSLGNIRALPQSLSKTTAYNVDNKYFPFLEYYTCSDTEKQALKDKIKYNGMTVGVIGTIYAYLQEDYSYIKGKLIRAESLPTDYNITNAIATELYQGVFIK